MQLDAASERAISGHRTREGPESCGLRGGKTHLLDRADCGRVGRPALTAARCGPRMVDVGAGRMSGRSSSRPRLLGRSRQLEMWHPRRCGRDGNRVSKTHRCVALVRGYGSATGAHIPAQRGRWSWLLTSTSDSRVESRTTLGGSWAYCTVCGGVTKRRSIRDDTRVGKRTGCAE